MITITEQQVNHFRRLNQKFRTNIAYFIHHRQRILQDFRRRQLRNRYLVNTQRVRATYRLRDANSCWLVALQIRHNRWRRRGGVFRASRTTLPNSLHTSSKRHHGVRSAERGCRLRFAPRPHCRRKMIIKYASDGSRRIIVSESPRKLLQKRRPAHRNGRAIKLLSKLRQKRVRKQPEKVADKLDNVGNEKTPAQSPFKEPVETPKISTSATRATELFSDLSEDDLDDYLNPETGEFFSRSSAKKPVQVSDIDSDEDFSDPPPKIASIDPTDDGKLSDVSDDITDTELAAVNSPAVEPDDKDDDDDRSASPPEPKRRRSADSPPAPALHMQIREQLAFLKMGKRKEPFLAESIGCVRTARTTHLGTPLFPRHISDQMLPAAIPSDTTSNRPLSASSTPKPDDDAAQLLIDPLTPGRRNFIDSLINKLKTTPETPTASSNAVVSTATVKSSSRPRVQLADADTSDHSSDNAEFHGFPAVSGSVPGMLPTPIVHNSSSDQSAFVSEALDTFMKENALDGSASVQLPTVQPRTDEALVSADTQPPHLACPLRPLHLERPRTLAEKRAQMARETDLRIRMLDNESYVHRALKRRTEAAALATGVLPPPHPYIAELQQHPIPFSRDCWRATCWLATPMGRYYYQTIRTPCGQELALYGSLGDHATRCAWSMPKYKPAPVLERQLESGQPHRCKARCRPLANSLSIRNLDEYMARVYPATNNGSSSGEEVKPDSTEASSAVSRNVSKLRTALARSGGGCRPCPLSRKHLHAARASLDCDLGPLQIYHMPTVHLEVWPRVDGPLPDPIRPYLKMVMPYECMTEQWVQFALSTLLVPEVKVPKAKRGRPPRNSYAEDGSRVGVADRRSRSRGSTPGITTAATAEEDSQCDQSFTFDIPYANDQSRLLVRKRINHLPGGVCAAVGGGGVVEVISTAPLLFDQHVSADDVLAQSVAAVLRSMMDSVEIACMEQTTEARNDPDLRYDSTDVKSEQAAAQGRKAGTTPVGETFRKEKNCLQGIRRELKRLNATIIDDYVAPAKANCSEVFCKLGCICDSLSVRKCHPEHCRKIQCMFECVCPRKSIATIEKHNNSSIEQIRHRANASLAKEEREFRATVVLSEDRTIYIPNRENAGKRNKRVPKRYHDAANDETTSSQSPPSPPNKRQARADADETDTKPDSKSKDIAQKASPSAVDLYPQRVAFELDRMRHCSVSLPMLPSSLTSTLEPLCYVHQLYKCFCKLRATTGEPFKFDADTNEAEAEAAATADTDHHMATLADGADGDDTYAPPAKKRYTFEKEEAPAEPEAPKSNDIDRWAHCARTRTVFATRRSRKVVLAERAQCRKHERENPELLKLLNNRIHHCLALCDGRLDTVENPSPERRRNGKAAKQAPIIDRTHAEESTTQPAAEISVPKSKRHVTPPPPSSRKLEVPRISPSPPPPPSSAATPHFSATADAAVATSPRSSIAHNERMRLRHQHNMKYFNYCVNRTMEQIKQAQINTLHVKNPVANSLNCIQWNRFVELFHRGAIFVWEIRLGSREVILGLTGKNVMPLIPGALCVINVRAVSVAKLPLLAQMLVRNEMSTACTAQTAVLLCGKTNYWKIISIINSMKDYLLHDERIQPSPRTHPQLANKISHLFKMLTNKRKTVTDVPPTEPAMVSAAPTPTTAAQPDNELPLAVVSSVAKTVTTTSSEQPHAQTPPAVAAPAPAASAKAPKSISISRRFTQQALGRKNACNIPMGDTRHLDSIFLPIPEVGSHRWLMLHIEPDFTHILIPSWKTLLSYDKIRSALQLARTSNKTVKISAPNIIPDVYAAPNESNKIFLGPYTLDAVLDLCLFREFAGRLCLLDDYERMLGRTTVEASARKTIGHWLLLKAKGLDSNGQPLDVGSATSTEVVEAPRLAEKDAEAALEAEQQNREAGSDDDDCMIIETQIDQIDLGEEETDAIGPQTNGTAAASAHEGAQLPITVHIGVVDSSAPASTSTPQLQSGEGHEILRSSAKPMISLSPPSSLTYLPAPNQRQRTDKHRSLLPALSAISTEGSRSTPAATNAVSLPKLTRIINSRPALSENGHPTVTLRLGVLPSSRLPEETQAAAAAIPPPPPPAPLPTIVSVYSGRNPAQRTAAPSSRTSSTVAGPGLQISATNLKDLVAAKMQSRLPSSLVITTCPQQKSPALPAAAPPPPPPPPLKVAPKTSDTDIITLESDEDEEDVKTVAQSSGKTTISIVPATVHTSVSSQAVARVTTSSTSAISTGSGVLPSSGYLVCSLGRSMGRIEARVGPQGLQMRFFDSAEWTPPQNSSSGANLLIEEHVRAHVFAFEPRTLQLQWKYYSQANMSPVLDAYPMQSAAVLTSTSVVTDVGRIELRADFETGSTLSRELLLRLLLLKLAYLCRVDKVEVRTRSFKEILARGEQYIRLLCKREVKYERLKMSWAVKIRMNQNKLRDMQAQSKRTATKKASAGSNRKTGNQSRKVSAEESVADEVDIIEIEDDDDAMNTSEQAIA